MGNCTTNQNVFESEEFINSLIAKIKDELLRSNVSNGTEPLPNMPCISRLSQEFSVCENTDDRITLVCPNGEKFLLTKIKNESQQTKENVPQKICKATFKAKFKMPSAPKDFNDTCSLDCTDNELSPDLEEEQYKRKEDEPVTFKVSDFVKNISQRYQSSSTSKASLTEDLATNYESRNSSKISFIPQHIKSKHIRQVKDFSLDNDISKAINLSK